MHAHKCMHTHIIKHLVFVSQGIEILWDDDLPETGVCMCVCVNVCVRSLGLRPPVHSCVIRVKRIYF
jgi:hypothetical protein